MSARTLPPVSASPGGLPRDFFSLVPEKLLSLVPLFEDDQIIDDDGFGLFWLGSTHRATS